MRALITGGAGFIGSHLAERLVGAGHEGVVIDDPRPGRRSNNWFVKGRARIWIG